MNARESFKHELAHTLGITVSALSAAMTEREFRRWHRYAADQLMPARRVEIGLAMVSLVIARVMGGDKDHTLEDFMPARRGQRAKEDNISDVVAAIPAQAFRLGQGRKKKG